MVGRACTIAAALGLAALLGTADAPNAAAALISAGSRSYWRVVAWAILWHLAGGLLAGSAVAATLLHLVHVPPHLLQPTLATGCVAAIGFTELTTRRGIPTSASVGLVGGLAGAGLVAGGWHAVEWGGLRGLRLVGVNGVLAGIVLAPLLGAGVAALLAGPARALAQRLRRRLVGAVRGGVWLACAAVALADGSNDGQKAMAVLAVGAGGSGVAGAAHGLSLADRVPVAVVLALAAGLTGRRIVRRVARGLAPIDAMSGLAAQTASAAVILGSGALGLPLSTSTVVASGMVGVATPRRRRHVRWRGVGAIVAAWMVTVPACALLGAGLLAAWRAVAG
ncbi:MAG TPA: inorganic phosphate transporter [Actinomycetota bacterium]|nr:inorganic phosphate transporter [Actinomycetota bacterium]